MYVGNKIELFLICMRRENQGLNIGSISSEGEMQYQQNTPNQLTCPKSNGTRLDKPGVGGSNPPPATPLKSLIILIQGLICLFYDNLEKCTDVLISNHCYSPLSTICIRFCVYIFSFYGRID